MTTAITESLPILKGEPFRQRIEEICRQVPQPQPVDGIRYKNILIPQMVGGELEFAVMGFLGQSLRMRGASVTGLLCDSFLPACVCRKVDHHESACTRWCHRNSGPFARAMRFPHRWYSEFIRDSEKTQCIDLANSLAIDEIEAFRFHDIPVGSLVAESMESYFLVGRCDWRDPEVQRKAREFLLSAFCLTIIANRAMDEFATQKVLSDCGMHVDWGVFRLVANQRGIPVDVLNVGLRGNSLKLETDRPGQITQRVPGWHAWRDIPLTDEQNRKLDEYLNRREKVPYEFKGEKWQSRVTDVDRVAEAVGLPAERSGKVFSMFPNVGYDAGKLKTDFAFEHISDWIVQTVAWFADRPEHHLIIKIHPGEVHREARDLTADLLTQHFSNLPSNVHVVQPITDITAHSVVKLADVVLTFTSTVSAEAAGLGKPVIMTGGGRHAGHDVTIDATSPEAYFAMLADICEGRWMPYSPGDLGRRYAYSLFFRADIPLNHFRRYDMDIAEIHINSLEDLLPGRDLCMDAMCREVLCDDLFENPIQ